MIRLGNAGIWATFERSDRMHFFFGYGIDAPRESACGMTTMIDLNRQLRKRCAKCLTWARKEGITNA